MKIKDKMAKFKTVPRTNKEKTEKKTVSFADDQQIDNEKNASKIEVKNVSKESNESSKSQSPPISTTILPPPTTSQLPSSAPIVTQPPVAPKDPLPNLGATLNGTKFSTAPKKILPRAQREKLENKAREAIVNGVPTDKQETTIAGTSSSTEPSQNETATSIATSVTESTA